MKFAYDFTHLSTLVVAMACALGVAAFAGMLVMASFARTRAVKRFGDPDLVGKLESFEVGDAHPSQDPVREGA